MVSSIRFLDNDYQVRIMDNSISETIQDIVLAKDLLERYVKNGSLSFDEKKTLWRIFCQHSNTDQLVDDAERAAHNNLDELYNETLTLQGKAQELVNLFRSSQEVLASFSTREDCDLYLKPFYDAKKKAEQEAQEVYQEYLPLYNKYDNWGYMHDDSDKDEYEKLELEHDTKKALYDKLHAEAKRMNDVYMAELRRISGLMYFEVSMLKLLAANIVIVAQGILADIESYKKEGGYGN